MAILKCKMCGAPLNIEEKQQTVRCRYCESVQTIPKFDNELKIQMFERANELRFRCEFDQASTVFQNITTQFPEEAEAYWGLCLCKYGIEYVDDPATLAKTPTCHRTHAQSILSDGNFLSACEYSGAARWKYEEEAREIDEIQKKILEISQAEQPYDIFICYKETDDATGVRSEDSIAAQDIYTELVKNNYRVFYARNSLRGKAGSEYEPYIYAALSSAKIMLVLGSKKEYFEAVWLKNEWLRYLNMIQNGSKTIIPCFEKISATDLPVQLRNFQALDMGNKIFFSDLINSIERIIPANKSVVIAKTGTAEDFSTSPRKKELNFDDRVYIGEALGDRPHGYGTCFYTNGDKYEGNWNMGSINGEGTFTYKNGDSWSGEWNKGKAWNGSGKYEDSDRICYEGILKNGTLNGEGKIYIKGKVAREGLFENGKLNGQGVAHVHNETCAGIFRDGRPWNADGTYILPQKVPAIFRGHWEDGVPSGEGLVEFLNSTAQIRGTFNNGLNGEVSWLFSNGQCYKGRIKDGKLYGFGKMFSKDGHLIYEGVYENSEPNGRGIMYFPNGNRYEGEFVDGKFNGQGTFYYPQGSWSGEWKNGKRWKGNGLILFYDKEGKATGKFFNGYMVNGKAAGKGMLRMQDGSRFDGEFLNDNYYNGNVYNAHNQIIDTYINGESKQQKAYNRNQNIAGIALGIANWL